MRYLLDTNIISGLIHKPQGHAASKRASAGLGSQVEGFLNTRQMLPLKEPADRPQHEKRGQTLWR
jgi:hypothetical protein